MGDAVDRLSDYCCPIRASKRASKIPQESLKRIRCCSTQWAGDWTMRRMRIGVVV